MALFDEIRRRNVHRVAIAYVAAAWLLVQVIDTLFPLFGLPDSVARGAVIALAIGFVPAVVLAWVFELTPDGLVRDTGQPIASNTSAAKNADRVIILVLALAVSYFAIDKFILEQKAELDKSIAVLPLANLSDDPDNEYFADGMTEELINLLVQIPGLDVTSRSTVFTYKDRDVVIPEVARELGVSYLLEGSVRRSAERIRVTVQLIDGTTDTHVWSENFDREFSDIFVIQDDIAAAVMDRLRIHLGEPTPTHDRIDPDAYALYMEALHIVEQGIFPSYDQAGEKLERLLVLEPDYIPGLGLYARYQVLRPESPDIPSQEEREQQARRIVDRMIELAPDSSFTRGWQYWIANNWDLEPELALQHLEKAIADNPWQPPNVLRWASSAFRRAGRIDEAWALGAYVFERDPSCRLCVQNLLYLARRSGRYQEALDLLEQYETWLSRSPAVNWNLGMLSLDIGDPGRALEFFEQIPTDDTGFDGNRESGILMALHDLGRTDEFNRRFEAYRQDQREWPESIARVYGWIGDADRAFEYFDRAIEIHGDEALNGLEIDYFASLRQDPRYVVLRKRYDQVFGIGLDFNPEFPPELQAIIDAAVR